MAFLGGNSNDSSSNKISSATIITSCMDVKGSFEGTDTIHVDGKITGNISVNNTLVIGKTGIVIGDVRAKHAIINGELQGSIICDELEVMRTGKLSSEAQAQNIIIDGEVQGYIMGHKSINILEIGTLKANKVQSKNIKVHGIIKGTIIATELLQVGTNGSVEGEISVKNISTAEGGKVSGSMSLYEFNDIED